MRVLVGLACVAAIALQGCHSEVPEARIPPRDILRNYRAELDAFVVAPDREAALARTCNAIAREEGASEEKVREIIMWGCPDEDVAAYIFSEEAAKVTDDRAAIEYCRSVSARVPGTCLGAAAVDVLLARMRNRDATEFENEAATIAGGANAREKFVALFRLAEYKRATGPAPEAARRFLELVAYNGERVAATGALNAAITALTEAQMLVEADCIEATPFRGRCAGAFLAQAGKAGRGGAFEETMAVCRRARGALEALDADSTITAYSQFAESVQKLLRGDAMSGDEAVCMHASCFASAKRLNDMFGGDFIFFRGAGRNKLPSAGKAEGISGLLCELSLACLDLSARETPIEDHAYLKVVQGHAALLKRLNHRERVLAVYNGFLAKYAQSPFAPALMLEMGDYCKDGCQTPAQAQDVYRTLYETYSTTREARVARLKQALCMYELAAYEDAYSLLQIIAAENDSASDIPTAQFLLGLTEAAMGLNEDAEARLVELPAIFPEHECAAKALFWVANNRLGRQEYEEARDVFNELVERYPKSSYAMKAREYARRLTSLDTHAAR